MVNGESSDYAPLLFILFFKSHQIFMGGKSNDRILNVTFNSNVIKLLPSRVKINHA